MWLKLGAVNLVMDYVTYFQDGGTPLFVACQCNHLDVVEELLRHNADLQVQMVDGATPLFIAAQNGHLKMLKFLLSKGAQPNVRRKVRNVCLYVCMCVWWKLL